MNPIYTVHNSRMALTVYDDLDRTRTWRGETQPSPAFRFELTPKSEVGPGRYALNRAGTLGHNLSLDRARLLFFDLAHGYFNEDYQVIFRNDNGHKVERTGGYQARMLTATYRAYNAIHNSTPRVVLEIWDGPGAWDHKAQWAYPLNKEQHALAIMLELVEARQLALAALDVIQTWNTVKLLRDWGVIGEPALVVPRQLTLLEAVG
ncbi:MAG: hypothetical protein FOGNACKC_06096 [Anaerolineae bacterium]|nr:hypothetical protein [Anaerolineae bacterium]